MSASSIKRGLKKVIGDNTILLIRKKRGDMAYFLLRLVLVNRLFLKLYLLLTSDYDREIQSVIAGRLQHRKDFWGASRVNYFLRRSVHRIEKGLSMQPRRDVFAEEIIGATVDAFVSTVRAQQGLDDLRWAHDVLTEYFTVCEPTSKVVAARNSFESVVAAYVRPVEAEKKLIPYPRKMSPALSVEYEALLQLSRRRRSVRWYQQKPVPRELIDKAVSLAALSPSACNRQPFYFSVVDSPAMLEKTRLLPMGIKGFAENIPVMVAVVGQLRAYSKPRDRHAIYVDGALAAMSFMYAIETLGLASCPINWPDIESRERQAANDLGLAEDERIVMWISVGYPSEEGYVPCSDKLSLDNIRTYH